MVREGCSAARRHGAAPPLPAPGSLAAFRHSRVMNNQPNERRETQLAPNTRVLRAGLIKPPSVQGASPAAAREPGSWQHSWAHQVFGGVIPPCPSRKTPQKKLKWKVWSSYFQALGFLSWLTRCKGCSCSYRREAARGLETFLLLASAGENPSHPLCLSFPISH